MKFIFLLFLIMSCGHHASQIEVVKVSNEKFWIGKSGDELITHPKFAVMPVEERKTKTGIEVRAYKNSAGVSTYSNCVGAGCSASGVEVVCNHIFSLKKDIIFKYQRTGMCGDESFAYRPLDINGQPLIAPEELEYYERVRSASGCFSDSECKDGKVCATVKGEYPGMCVGKF